MDPAVLRVMAPSLAAIAVFAIIAMSVEEWITRGRWRDPDYTLCIGITKWWMRFEVARVALGFVLYVKRTPDFASTPDPELLLILSGYLLLFAPALAPAVFMWVVLGAANNEPTEDEVAIRARMRRKREEYLNRGRRD